MNEYIYIYIYISVVHINIYDMCVCIYIYIYLYINKFLEGKQILNEILVFVYIISIIFLNL